MPSSISSNGFRSCATKITVMRRSRRSRPPGARSRAGSCRSRLASGSSSNSRRGCGQQRLGDQQPLLLAARQQPDRRYRHTRGADRFERFGSTARRSAADAGPKPQRSPDQAEHHQVVAAHRQVRRQPAALGDVANRRDCRARAAAQHAHAAFAPAAPGRAARAATSSCPCRSDRSVQRTRRRRARGWPTTRSCVVRRRPRRLRTPPPASLRGRPGIG